MTHPGVTGDGDIRRASATIAAGTLVSRALGFANIAVLAWVLGQQNPGANAFALANTIPSNIFALVAGGLTSAVLVPQIVRASRDRDGGQAYVNKLLTLGISACFAIGAGVTFAAPLVIRLNISEGGAFDADAVALATAFAYWCLPQVFFYAVYALLGETLNARRIFGPFTWAPVLNNLVLIGSLLLFASLFGADPAHRDPARWTHEQIALLGGGATLGIAAQCALLTLFWRRTGLRFRPDFRWKGVGLRKTGTTAAWMFGMVVVTQATILVQSRVATLAGPDDPSVAVLNTTWLLFMLPHSILVLSIATPFFTRMSAHAHAGDLGSLRDDLSLSLRVVVMFVAGAAAALAAAAIPFGAFFGRESAEVVGISSVLVAYLVGLVPFSAMFLLQRGFFALGDTRTPFLIKLLQGIAVTLLLVLVGVAVSAPHVAIGVALATSLASALQAIVLAGALGRRLGGLDGRRVLKRLAVFVSAATFAMLCGLGVLALLGGFSQGFAVSSIGSAFVSIVVVGASVLMMYLGLLVLLRAPEIRTVLAPLARRRRTAR